MAVRDDGGVSNRSRVRGQEPQVEAVKAADRRQKIRDHRSGKQDQTGKWGTEDQKRMSEVRGPGLGIRMLGPESGDRG